MNIHLYLFDCARGTNLDQEWCLIERKRKLDTVNQFFFYFLSFSFTYMRVQ